MAQSLHKVFLSHTSELAQFPEKTSFVQAAKSALATAKALAVDMEYFGAHDQTAASVCREKLGECDVYVGILGFRYGSIVPGSEISYTELEFDAATAANLPRLVFVLHEGAEIPVRLVDSDRTRQDEFRRRVRAAGLVTEYFRTPDELARQVYQALSQLFIKSNAPNAAPKANVPWMTPPSWEDIVPRAGLFAEIKQMLLAPEAGSVGITTGLHGTGGFGKTTLAAEICRDAEIRERFPGGMLWITVGEQPSEAALAAKINDLSEQLSGVRPTLSDPEQAGHRLGELMAENEILLVIDDVWTRPQLNALLHGARRCTRLITTRNHGVLPLDGMAVEVGVMEVSEAQTLLTLGLPDLPAAYVGSLLRMTGRWPVLLTLVNRTIRRLVHRGMGAEAAASRIQERLRTGPTALDMRRPRERAEAVEATIAASLDVLDSEQLERYLDLAVFPEDQQIPIAVLRLWWRRHAWSDSAVEQFCEELAELSLLQSYLPGADTVSMHDVIRGYLRGRCGAPRLHAINDDLLAAAASTVPDTADEPGDAELTPWWLLPDEQQYLWLNLGYHLSESSHRAQLDRLACDLRWITAKLERHGPVEVESDLALSSGPIVADLRREIGRSAHLLGPIEPRESLQDILLSRLHGVTALEGLVKTYEDAFRKPHLCPSRRLPDWPHTALLRILVGATGRVLGCSASPDGNSLLGGGEDHKLRLWDVETGETTLVLDQHTGPVWSCAMAPDGTWAASGSDDHTVRLWDTRTGMQIAELRHHQGPVRACVIDPGNEWVASAGDDRTICIWSRRSRQVTAVLDGHQGIVRSLAVSSDGTWLVSGGDDNTVRVWDVGSGRQRFALAGHTDSIWAVAVGPDDEWFCSGGLDRTVRVWSAQSGEQLKSLQTPSGPVLAHGSAPWGTWLATGGDEGTIQIWDLANSELRGVLSGHTGRVRACAADPDGRWLATAGDDHSIRTWDIWAVDGSTLTDRHQGPEWICAAARHQPLALTAGSDRAVRLWHGSQAQEEILATLPMQPWSGALSPDGVKAVVATQQGRLWQWDTEGTHVLSRQMHDGPIWSCRYSEDGQALLTAGEDRAVRLWDVADLTLRQEFRYPCAVRAAAMAPHEGWFAAADDKGMVRVTDLASRTAIANWQAGTGLIWTCEVSPDGEWIATGGQDRMIRLWSPGGAARGTLAGHEGQVRGCAFSPDGALLASTGDDCTFRIWRMADRRCLAAMRVGRPFASCCWLSEGETIHLVGHGGLYTFNIASLA